MFKRFQNVYKSSLAQSVLFGVVITLIFSGLWNSDIRRFKVELEPFEMIGIEQNAWFSCDFDNDGNSERLRCYPETELKSMGIVHYDKDGFITDNFHFFDFSWVPLLKPAIFDINNDSTQEILFFNIRNDSIFFNAFSLSEFQPLIDPLFFKTIERKSDHYSLRSEFYSLEYNESDGSSDLLFFFDAGFGLYPRGIFKLKLPSGRFSASPTEYMPLTMNYISDFDKDGSDEIFCADYSPSNVDTFQKYTDTISYVVVLNADLEFEFEPIPLAGMFGSVKMIPDPDTDSIFYVLYVSRSATDHPIRVHVLNSKGEILETKNWDINRDLENYVADVKLINGRSYLVIRGVGTFRLTPDLRLLPGEIEADLNEKTRIPVLYDLNGDGFDEWIYTSNKDIITVYNEKTNEEIAFESPILIVGNLKIQAFLRNHVVEKFLVDTGAGFFYFKYEHNPFYFVLYLIYSGVFLLSSSVLFVILFWQKRNIEKKWNTEKQLTELQFNAVKNQLNPHFLFNSLNSVALMINEGKSTEAYDFLSLNSRMIQRVMDDAGQISRSLENEIQFTKDYLNIQKRRFKTRFEYSIEISPGVDPEFEVPKMCIHTYAENAIKHGFRNTTANGVLQIKIEKFGNGIRVLISDNGMGRAAAAQYSDSSGNGIKIMNEFYRLFEKYHGYSIIFSILDNRDDKANTTGTRVILSIRKN